MPRILPRLAVCIAALAAVAVVVPTAQAAQLLERQLTSATKSSRICHERVATGARGVRSERVALAGPSIVTARLAGRSGDWDVALFNARTRKLVAASAGLNSVEVAQGYAGRGELIVQACRRSGRGAVKLTLSRLALRGARSADMKLLKVSTPSRAHKTALTNLGLDVTEHAGHDYVEVVTYSAGDLERLRKAGFSWEVSIADLQAHGRRIARENALFAARTQTSLLPSKRDAYRRLADYEANMKQLVEDHPSLVRAFVLPNRTIEGREVMGIEIARDVHASDGRPTFALMGLHHAREWPSGEHTMEFAYDLVKGYGTDARITDLLGRARAVFVPVVNADGFNVSREHLGLPERGQTTANVLADPASEYRRRNCRLAGAPPARPGEIAPPTQFPAGACMLPSSRLLGVDPNRNYGALWGGPGASALPAYDTYRGSGPFSEPETQNVRWLVSTRQVTTLITNHTYSNLILRAPGVKAQGVPVDEERMRDLGAQMAAQNGYTSQPGWALYDTTGTTEDWSYNATGGYGYTFEIGPNTFHPAFEVVISEYLGHGKYAGKGNRAAYLIALENAAEPKQHSVVTGTAKAGTVLRMKKSFETETSPVRPAETGVLECGPTAVVTSRDTGAQRFTDTLVSEMNGRAGRFEWHVNPSTRPAVQEKREVVTRDVWSRTWERGPDAADPSVTALSHHDHAFEIPAGQSAEYLAISLDWQVHGTGTTPEDYDLEVYRTNGSTNEDDWEKIGSAGNWPGCPEYTEIPFPGAGQYVIRVLNFAAAAQQWQLTAALKEQVGYRTLTPGGEPESYELTCETPDGQVLGRREVTVGRGQRVNVGQVCRGA